MDPTVPQDWIANIFPEGAVQYVSGSAFIARDLSSYNAMIDQERQAVENFWSRLDRRNPDE
jgi:hypothetical protein